MRSYNFSVDGSRANVVNVQINNPGTATTGQFFADTGTGMALRLEATVTVSGDVATVTIPASLASQMFNSRWQLRVIDGSTAVPVAEGRARLGVSNSENVEIDNSDGVPIAVSIDRTTTQPVTGTVELGATSLSALEVVSLSPESLSALETTNLGPSTEIIGYTSSSLSRKVAEGKVFIGGTAITLGGLASAERACLQLSNPAGSTKALYIFGLTVYSTIAQQVVYMEDAIMAGTITTVPPFNINRASSATSVAAATVSTSAPSGGALWPNQSRVNTQSGLQVSLPPVVLPPGKSFLVRGTIGDAQTFTANAYWFEE